MYFKKITLNNFRNYKNLELEFDKNLNLFLGKNAQGKTNLLESLFITGLGKSFRTNKDQDMIAFGEKNSKVICLVGQDDNNETEIEINFSNEGKIIKVDGVKLQRTIDLLENVYIVVFSPDDLRIVKDGPDNRRRFLDRELCQIKPLYYSDLGNYKKVLKQRNQLLREKNKDKKLFEVFDESLANYGIRIVNERKIFTERLLNISKNIHKEISQGAENLEISYETKITTNEEYIDQLHKNMENDYIKGYTSFGPHKDDLAISINGTDIRQFGSQGQQRTASLSMKLAEIGLIKQETGENAVLLLDDVLSELDKDRQRYLIEAMKDVQVFVTATEVDEDLKNKLPKGNTYNVDNGKVYLYNI
ncbi:MAG: DNA replication/repair protein RecF [Clostridia bacterium]|nr:DNA replication/repair protein RecF [Clostridia bacterium]